LRTPEISPQTPQPGIQSLGPLSTMLPVQSRHSVSLTHATQSLPHFITLFSPTSVSLTPPRNHRTQSFVEFHPVLGTYAQMPPPSKCFVHVGGWLAESTREPALLRRRPALPTFNTDIYVLVWSPPLASKFLKGRNYLLHLCLPGSSQQGVCRARLGKYLFVECL
jgi:hypothetical protein